MSKAWKTVEFSLCQKCPFLSLLIFCSRCDGAWSSSRDGLELQLRASQCSLFIAREGAKEWNFSLLSSCDATNRKWDLLNLMTWMRSFTVFLKSECASQSPGAACYNSNCWAPPLEFLNGLVGLGPRTCISHRFCDNADAALEWLSVQIKTITCGNRLSQRNALTVHQSFWWSHYPCQMKISHSRASISMAKVLFYK